MKYVIPLSDAEIETLQQMHAYHREHSVILTSHRWPPL